MSEPSTPLSIPSAVGIKVPQTDDRWKVGPLLESGVLSTLHELVRHDGFVSFSLVVKAVHTMSTTTLNKRSIASEMLKKKQLLHPRSVAGLWGKCDGPAYYSNVDGFDLLILERQIQQQQQQAPRFNPWNWVTTNRASLPEPPPIDDVDGDTTTLRQHQPIRMFTKVPITAAELVCYCPSKSTSAPLSRDSVATRRLDATDKNSSETEESPFIDGTSPLTSPSMTDSCADEEETIVDTTHRDCGEATSVDDKNSKVDATAYSEEDTKIEDVSVSSVSPPRNNTTAVVSTRALPSAVASPRPLVAAAAYTSPAAHSSRFRDGSYDGTSFDDGASHESTTTNGNGEDHDGDRCSDIEVESPTTKNITVALLNMTVSSPPTTLATISTASVGTGTMSADSTTLESSNINDPPAAARKANNKTNGSGPESLARVVDVDLTGLSDSSDEEEEVDTDFGGDVDSTEPGQQESEIDDEEGEDEEVETEEDDDDDCGGGGDDENISTENVQAAQVPHRVKVMVLSPGQQKIEVTLSEGEELLLGSSPSQKALLGRRHIYVPRAEEEHCVLRLHIMRGSVIGVKIEPFNKGTTKLSTSHGSNWTDVFMNGTICLNHTAGKVILVNDDGTHTFITFPK